MNGKFRNALIAGGLVLAMAFALVSSLPQSAAAEQQAQRLISVTGEAKIDVKPDMAALTLGVETTAADAQTAQRNNSTTMTAIIDAVSAKGIAKDDIQTSNFSLYPTYEWQGDRSEKRVLVGYTCNNSVTVKVKDLTKIGTVIDAATSAGANNVNSLTFGVQNPNAYRSELLTSAISDAKVKADIIATAAGYKVTGIQKMSDANTSVQPVRFSFDNAAKVSAAGDVPIEVGSLTLSATVQIEYTF